MNKFTISSDNWHSYLKGDLGVAHLDIDKIVKQAKNDKIQIVLTLDDKPYCSLQYDKIKDDFIEKPLKNS